MMTYLILNVLFLLTVLIFLPQKITKPRSAWWVTLSVIVALTLVFDPIIIALDIVGYDNSKILGLKFFGAPVEDLFYALYAVIIVPLIWHRLGEKPHERAR